MNNTTKLMEKAALVRIRFGKMGQFRKADKTQINYNGADPNRHKSEKKLFTSPDYEAIGTFDGQVKRWLANRAINVQVGMEGTYIVPLALIDDIESELQARKEDRGRLVDSFFQVYDFEREQARVTLNGQFREKDFPPSYQVMDKFYMDWFYVTLGTPENLPPEILERELKAHQERFAEIENQCREALRESMNALLAHLIEKLTPGQDGKMKKWYDSNLGNLVEFLDLFERRNITDDADLGRLVSQAKMVLVGVNGDRIKNDAAFRSALKTNVSIINGKLNDLIIAQPSRKFNLDD
jgi:hypothetical protein